MFLLAALLSMYAVYIVLKIPAVTRATAPLVEPTPNHKGETMHKQTPEDIFLRRDAGSNPGLDLKANPIGIVSDISEHGVVPTVPALHPLDGFAPMWRDALYAATKPPEAMPECCNKPEFKHVDEATLATYTQASTMALHVHHDSPVVLEN